MARLRHSAALAAAALLACRRMPPPPPQAPRVELRLAALFREAEVRSDAFDLQFLVRRGALVAPGWQLPQPDATGFVVWSRQQEAAVRLPFVTATPKQLVLRGRCHPGLGPRLRVEVRFDDLALGALTLTPRDQEFRLAIPAEAQSPGSHRLVLSADRLWRPPKSDRDTSPASFALSSLSAQRADGVAAAGPPSVEGDKLRLPGGTSLAFFLRHRPGAELQAVASGRGRLSVALETRDARRALADVPLTGAAARSVGARLEAPAGAFTRLELANLEPAGSVELQGVLSQPRAEPRVSRPARFPERPNVIVFLVDTLRADRLGVYGHTAPTSPALDALARESVVFDDAWAQAPWTRPTVASIFTGLHPSTHGAGGFRLGLADHLETLAEVMKAAGYRTGAMVSNHVVNLRFGFAQGFDNWNDGEEKLYGLSAAEVVSRGLRFVDQGGGPVFLYLHTLEPHAPYEPTNESWVHFREPGTIRRESKPLLMRRFLPSADARYLDSLYQGEILDDDKAFEVLIAGLRSRGLLDDTLLLFTADHGEEFLDHGGKGHGHTLYRELIRVPLVVRLPGGARAGTREAAPVAQVDLLPTLATLVGAKVPQGVEGRDLSALWLGQRHDAEEPELVAETRFGKSEKYTLRLGALKLIVNLDPRRYGKAGGTSELYDLGVDPRERADLLARDPIAFGYMDRRLEALLRQQQAAHDARKTNVEVELSEEDREQLRALGYVQ